MEKYEYESLTTPPVKKSSWKSKIPSTVFWVGALTATAVFSVTSWQKPQLLPWNLSTQTTDGTAVKDAKVTKRYNITVGARWMNLDGGRWRTMFVCNGQSPCPTLTAQEGDDVEIYVTNDLGAQISIHWSGMNHHHYGFWNDGTGGLNQFPILPRGNWTSKFDTTGHWGLNWYADHTGAGVADGVYGMIYTAPSPKRPRPYSMITKDFSELRQIQDAEDKIRHVALWNSDFLTAAWKFDRLKATGQGLYCYKSILVNGKGRTFCKHPDFNTIDGEELDAAGCKIQPGFKGDECTPSHADLEVFETHGERYIMLNLINVGFEHALKFSIDSHKFWVVADDSGFIEPQEVQVLYITNGARHTILVKLDQTPADYSMRLVSTSTLQNLQGMSLLRYPSVRYPVYGQPMPLPEITDSTEICLNPDGSVPSSCKELDPSSVKTHPRTSPPKSSNLTLSWKTGSRPNAAFPIVTEFFLNQQPWQLFRAAQEPVYFTRNVSALPLPVQAGLPLGTVVDLIVQNTLNETIPMYKHGNPTFRLGAKANEEFGYGSIEAAVKGRKGGLNVGDPPLAVVHDLPPLGWLAIRWRVEIVGATMFHAVKLKYFALGMAAPLLEGIETSVREEIPEFAMEQPHVEFAPANDGVFG